MTARNRRIDETAAADPAAAALPGNAAVSPSPPRLKAVSITKRYGETQVLREVSLDLCPGETLAIVGESGCGKTTLLKIVAGLLTPSSGEIIVNGKSLSGVAARERGIVYLDQEPLLFEHLSVRENVAFALRLRNCDGAAVETAIESMLAAISLAEHGGKREWELSGGQKQRVAFARAVLAAPRVLLLDEPFSNLDGSTRSVMRALFGQLREKFSLTSLFVTHDVKEALLVGDRFALMAEGRLQVFPNRDSFLSDEATGIPRERRFWEQIGGDPTGLCDDQRAEPQSQPHNPKRQRGSA